jgi:hypothetical protein
MERAVKILWCYSCAEHLARHGYWVVCTDELPNFQILERVPIRRAIPGSIEQREFEYKRHGTATVLVFLIVHTGRMEAVCFESQSAVHYTEALRHFRQRHRHLRGVYLIVGNGPKAHRCLGRSRHRPKPAGFGERARACWLAGGLTVG